MVMSVCVRVCGVIHGCSYGDDIDRQLVVQFCIIAHTHNTSKLCVCVL